MGENKSLRTLHRAVNVSSPLMHSADTPHTSALLMVGLETITALTPGALVMASRWTKPMRPMPVTKQQETIEQA